MKIQFPRLTSGAYMKTTVKVPVMHIRAPKRRIVVTLGDWWTTNGSRKMQATKNKAAIESLRPILSTMRADTMSPGNSEPNKSCY